MALISSSFYSPGETIFHKHPPFLRLVELIAFSSFIASIKSFDFIDLWRYGLIILYSIISAIISKINIRKIIKAEIFFLIMCSIMFVARLYSKEDLIRSVDSAINLFTIAQVAILYASLLNPVEIGDLFYRICRYIPFVKAGNVRTMTSLTLTSIPLIQETHKQIDDAAQSRLVSRNPIIKIVKTITPLLRELIIHSDRLEEAMLSRSYNENATLKPASKPKLTDLIIFIIAATIITVVKIF